MRRRDSEAGSALVPVAVASSAESSGIVMSAFSAMRPSRNARCGSSLAWRRPPLGLGASLPVASAWFMLYRIREACGPDLKKLRGVIEIDECFVGGIEANKHEHKKLKAGRGTGGKTPVLGMREKGDRTVAKTIANMDARTVQAEIHR